MPAEFTPVSALLGRVLAGLSTALLLRLDGRIACIGGARAGDIPTFRSIG